MSKNLRIVFMGTPDFAAAALKALCESHHEVVCVYSQPPRPKGRGLQEQKSAVHELAEQNNIPVLTPTSLKDPKAHSEFASHNADVAIVAAYGLLLPKEILRAPEHGCLNIHASLLPRWRGASPIQRAIWSGDEKSGVTIMQMDEGLDTGGILATSEIVLDRDITSPKLHNILAHIGGSLTLDVLDYLDEFVAEPQDEAFATYAHLLKKSDGQVDWTQSAHEIDRQIRALNPWPGVWTQADGKRLKILGAKMNPDRSNDAAGKILNRDGHVVCGDGSIIMLQKIQPAGKSVMDFGSAVNGGYIEVGQILS